ncbi:hypothetical protein, partial [Flavobacterium sp.]|uniref:hypothetical protein n=1 Tax=Flavobacterium sp. TaxID=239 RepID=UPI0037BF4C76
SLLNSTPKLKIFIPNNLSIKQIYKNMSNYGYTFTFSSISIVFLEVEQLKKDSTINTITFCILISFS